MKMIPALVSALALAACANSGDATIPRPLAPMAEPAGCLPPGWDRARLDDLKAAKFEIADTPARQAFATAITACLGSPQSAVRDGIAFEALTHMLRARQLDDATMRALLVDLTARLQAPDPEGFGQSFAALVLSELARADRVQAYLTEAERAKLLVDAQQWFINVSDYRGFDDADGWRHAVAHGSDLLMQLALNPQIDAEGLRLIVSAVGAQVAPESYAYIHGESERLTRPILFVAARGVMGEAAWTEWLMAIATPNDVSALLSSEAGLAWRHNILGFARAIYVEVVLGDDPADDVLRPGLEGLLRAIR